MIDGIWLQSFSIVSGLRPIYNQGAIVRFVKRRSGLWQDCNGPRRPLLGFTGHILQASRNSPPSCTIKTQSVLIALRLHKIQNLVAIHTDCGYGGLDCERIVTTQMSLFWGLRGTERIAEDPRAPVQACPWVRDQTWRSAVRLGLILDCAKIAQFSLDCALTSSIEPGLHGSQWVFILPTISSIAVGLLGFCNPTAIGIGELRDDWIVFREFS